jgi:hypothetical protein
MHTGSRTLQVTILFISFSLQPKGLVTTSTLRSPQLPLGQAVSGVSRIQTTTTKHLPEEALLLIII